MQILIAVSFCVRDSFVKGAPLVSPDKCPQQVRKAHAYYAAVTTMNAPMSRVTRLRDSAAVLTTLPVCNVNFVCRVSMVMRRLAELVRIQVFAVSIESTVLAIAIKHTVTVSFTATAQSQWCAFRRLSAMFVPW